MWVYAIQSAKDGRLYVGMTEDVSKRLIQHNHGKAKSTKGFVPWKLIYTEETIDRNSARKRELFLKAGSGKEFLKKIVVNG